MVIRVKALLSYDVQRIKVSLRMKLILLQERETLFCSGWPLQFPSFIRMIFSLPLQMTNCSACLVAKAAHFLKNSLFRAEIRCLLDRFPWESQLPNKASNSNHSSLPDEKTQYLCALGLYLTTSRIKN